jgi:hypothetical protein
VNDDEQSLKNLLAKSAPGDILALAEMATAIASAQISAGKPLTDEERAILDRALEAHPPTTRS